MKNKQIINLLWISLISFSISTATYGQWNVLGSAGFSASLAGYVKIAYDSHDTLYIAYQDAGNSSKVTVKKYEGSNWVTVGSAGFSAGAAYYLSLAFDSNNVPYVSYRDNGTSSKATVMKYNGSSWVNVGSAGFSSGQVLYTSLAFDSNDVPYLLFKDVNNSNKATLMKYSSGSWANVGSAGFSAGVINPNSLAFDSNDVPYAAYNDYGGADKAIVKKYSGGNWVTVGSAGISSGRANDVAVVFDKNDTAYLAVEDQGLNNKISVMKYNGSSWVTVGSSGFSDSVASYISLALDSNGIPYVAYQNNADNNTLAVKKFDGSSWVNVGSASVSAGQAFYISLAFDTGNSLSAGYSDAANSSKATVMKYSPLNTWNGSTWSLGTPDSTKNVDISSSVAPTSFTCSDLTIESGFALNTGTSNTVTIYGNLTNNGSGVSGTGTLNFAKTGTSTISGDTVAFNGTVTVSTGCTLATSNKLRLTSNSSNTGSIGQSSGTIAGNVMAQRYSTAKRAYRLYAHPFSSAIALSQLVDEIDITGNGGATNGFTPTNTNAPSAYWFDATAADTSTSSVNSGWTAFTSANTASWNQYQVLLLFLRGAKGEGLNGNSYTPSASTFEAAGTVNQGTQVVSLTQGTNSNFAAVGNPFPSGVQMNTVTLGGNVGANYYAWDATSGPAGAYVTNAFTLSYILPAYCGFFTTISANTSITIRESDKATGGAGLFKTTTPANWVELLISDSTTKWDRLLINLDDNAMDVEDKLDAKKLYNPGLDFYTLAKDNAHLAIDVRPYADSTGIPLGLTAYTRYNRYVIKTGMFDIPAGTKLILNDKYLNKQEELKAGTEYWFDVTSDTLSQGEKRFEINMAGKPASIIVNGKEMAKMQLIPNPAQNEVKLSFDKIQGAAQIKLMSVTGQVVYDNVVNASSGSVIIPLQTLPAGIYIAELQSNNARFTEKLIKE